jgi:hypothetical protein
MGLGQEARAKVAGSRPKSSCGVARQTRGTELSRQTGETEPGGQTGEVRSCNCPFPATLAARVGVLATVKSPQLMPSSLGR